MLSTQLLTQKYRPYIWFDTHLIVYIYTIIFLPVNKIVSKICKNCREIMRNNEVDSLKNRQKLTI